MKKAMIITVALAVCIAPALLVMHVGTTPLRSTVSAYAPHAPIIIDSNADFHATAALESWLGSGTLASPYIISGYEFAGPPDAYAFSVGNSTVHFILRDCYFHDSAAAIFMTLSSNGTIENNMVESCDMGIGTDGAGTIENNTVESCSIGIIMSSSSGTPTTAARNTVKNCAVGMMMGSSNGTVEGNTVMSCDMGMMMDAGGATIANNSISDCVYAVLDFFSTTGNTYSANNVSDNLLGIALSSYGNVLSGNTFWKNLYAGLLMGYSLSTTLRNNAFVQDGVVMSSSSVEGWNSQDIDTSNTVNGDPMLYLVDDVGSTVTAHYGQVILGNCTGTTIDSQDLDNTSVAIQVGFCSGVSVMNSVLRDCLAGMIASYSNNVTLTSTYCINNVFGIEIDESEFCTVSGNTIQGVATLTEIFGDWASLFDVGGITDSAGIVASYATDCTISGNIIVSEGAAISLSYSLRMLLTNNLMSASGIFIDGNFAEHWNTHDIDTTNTVNTLPVVYLKNLIGAPVPTGAGQVILANCSQMQVTGSYIDRATVAFLLGFTSGCRVTGFSASNCIYGVMLYESPGIQVDNAILTADDYGVYVVGSNLCTITTNQIKNCTSSAIMLVNSESQTLQFNAMTNCGIMISSEMLGGWNTHTIDISNFVNGDPVYYEKDSTGLTVLGGYGQVILANCASSVVGPQNIVNASAALQLGFCTDITVNNLNASENNYAVMMEYSNSCSLKGPTISHNNFGVYMEEGSYNTVTNGLFYMNDNFAIYMGYCQYNIVTGNKFQYNNGAGDVYDPKHVQAYDDDYGGSNSWNGTSGGNYWQDWLTPDENGDGIVDVPYELNGGFSLFGVGVAKDFMPLTGAQAIPEFAALVPVVAAVVLIVMLSGIARSRSRRRD